MYLLLILCTRICITLSWPGTHFILLSRDAEDAVYARDGYDYDGYRLRVEFPKGGGGSFRGGRSGGRGPPARRSQYRVMVTGQDTYTYRINCHY